MVTTVLYTFDAFRDWMKSIETRREDKALCVNQWEDEREVTQYTCGVKKFFETPQSDNDNGGGDNHYEPKVPFPSVENKHIYLKQMLNLQREADQNRLMAEMTGQGKIYNDWRL